MCGTLAIKGPLTVISYAGTYKAESFKADADIRFSPLSRVFKRLPDHLLTHKGFLDYYLSFIDSRAPCLFDPQEGSDETYILAGHSLGGGLAQLGALDIFNNNPRRYHEENNLSVLTFGCPPLFNAEAAAFMDLILPYTSNFRVVFDNDPFVNWTRGGQTSPFPIVHRRTENSKPGFVHAGREFELYSFDSSFRGISGFLFSKQSDTLLSNFSSGRVDLNLIESVSNIQYTHYVASYIEDFSSSLSGRYEGYGDTAFWQEVFDRTVDKAREQLKVMDEDFSEVLPKNKAVKSKRLPKNMDLIEYFFGKPLSVIRDTFELLCEAPSYLHHVTTLISFLGGFDNFDIYKKYKEELLGLSEIKESFIKNLLTLSEKLYFKMSRIPDLLHLKIIKNIIVEIADKIYSDSEEDFLRPSEETAIYNQWFTRKSLRKLCLPYEDRPLRELLDTSEEDFEELKLRLEAKRSRKWERLTLAQQIDYDQKTFEAKTVRELKETALGRGYRAGAVLALANPTLAFDRTCHYLTYFRYDAQLFREALTRTEMLLFENATDTWDYKSLVWDLRGTEDMECQKLAKLIGDKIGLKLENVN